MAADQRQARSHRLVFDREKSRADVGQQPKAAQRIHRACFFGEAREIHTAVGRRGLHRGQQIVGVLIDWTHADNDAEAMGRNGRRVQRRVGCRERAGAHEQLERAIQDAGVAFIFEIGGAGKVFHRGHDFCAEPFDLRRRGRKAGRAGRDAAPERVGSDADRRHDPETGDERTAAHMNYRRPPST